MFGDSNFDNDHIADRVKKCPCCCSNLGWSVIRCIFGLLSFGLFVCGLGVCIAAGSFGSDTWFKDMVTESGVNFKEGTVIMDKMYSTLKTWFILMGVCFLLYGCCGGAVIYLRKCYCTCCHCSSTIALLIFTLIMFVPLCAVWGMDTTTVDAFCKKDYSKLPFDMGDYFAKHPNQNAARYDTILNQPASVLCSDACPCAKVDQAKWPKDIQTLMKSGNEFEGSKGRSWNFSGKIKNMKDCVAHLKDKKTDEKYTCWALKQTQTEWTSENKNKEVKESNTSCSDKDSQKQAKKFEKLMDGVYMKIYKVLESKWDCQAMCKTSPFYMTKDVTVGPPKQGCAYAMKAYMDDHAASWGGGFIFFMFYIACVLCWSCSTFSFTGEEANEFTNKDGTVDKGRE